MFPKGCIYHIVMVMDVESESPFLDSVTVVRKFTEAFQNEFPDIPPKCEINLCIHLLPGKPRIYIPPYRMSLIKLKEFKKTLKNSLDKGFI